MRNRDFFYKTVGYCRYFLAFLVVLIIRAIKPFVLIRVGCLISSRIGHFAANTELYLCERDAGINLPSRRHLDLFYFESSPCNEQLALMWGRVLVICPRWLLAPISVVNAKIRGGFEHQALANSRDVDVNNLLERFPTHLHFTSEEVKAGNEGLLKIGIPFGAPFVCLMVRDSAYLKDQFKQGSFEEHCYRDSTIDNYVLAAESLAARGLFVIRMGAKVQFPLRSTHPMVIDYATNGMRSDFMDIYLGAKCTFCLTTGTGWDSIPDMFRRPMAYVNLVPLGNLHTFRSDYLSLSKTHRFIKGQRELTLREIFNVGAASSLETSDYLRLGVELLENTPEEIQEVAEEMADRVSGIWCDTEQDEVLQSKFWEVYRDEVQRSKERRSMHGALRGRYSTKFLRRNPEWLM